MIRSPGSRRPVFAISALFDDPERVDRAAGRLVQIGIPRDLIDVVVSPEAARRYYGGSRTARDRETFRYAGIGALIGLGIGVLVSLVLVALPGFRQPGGLAFVQLLGPNLATISGAVIGGITGAVVRRKRDMRHARAAEAPGSIVVAATARSQEEADVIARVLADAGGTAVRAEE